MYKDLCTKYTKNSYIGMPNLKQQGLERKLVHIRGGWGENVCEGFSFTFKALYSDWNKALIF